jgi:two-component system OmpR family sensor kinase/two-component system sensor histidine kinase BaeS
MLFLSVIGASTLVLRLMGRTNVSFSPIPIAVGLLIIVLGVLLPAIRRIGLPLGNIVEAANRVADGDFSTRLPECGPPSIRSVGRAFNSMTARLESQERQRRNLMAEVAHELRTPLSVIQGRLEGLLDGVYPKDNAQISEVLDETRILSRLVEDLQTLANAESGMLSLRKESTDIGILIQDVVDSFDSAEIHFVSPQNLPPVKIDPLRIREVLSNLLSNALRYSAGRSITISAVTDNDHLSISVADHGTGIAAEELPKIFDRFYRGSTSRGSGLGLTIARNFVEAHGGKIRAESHPGDGTVMTFTLPLAGG